MKFDERKMIKNIFSGMDWQEVLNTIVIEEALDPWDIDIVRLTDAFIEYLYAMKKFDFRIPGRFILIAAILLRMKCEILFQEEEEIKEEEKEEEIKIDLNEIPELSPPMTRRVTRKVTLQELIDALNKAFEFKEKKESRLHRIRRAAIDLIEETEDIEDMIERIYRKIRGMGDLIKFSDLVPEWRRREIVSTFIPVLHLANRGNISCEQKEMFKEIFIRIK